jgi:hypothetical protein
MLHEYAQVAAAPDVAAITLEPLLTSFDCSCPSLKLQRAKAGRLLTRDRGEVNLSRNALSAMESDM